MLLRSLFCPKSSHYLRLKNPFQHVYKRINGQSPSYMNELLILNSDINDRNSRYGSLNLVCPRFTRESEGGRSYSMRAARIWNTFPNSLKKSTNVHSFKNGLIEDTHRVIGS